MPRYTICQADWHERSASLNIPTLPSYPCVPGELLQVTHKIALASQQTICAVSLPNPVIYTTGLPKQPVFAYNLLACSATTTIPDRDVRFAVPAALYPVQTAAV